MAKFKIRLTKTFEVDTDEGELDPFFKEALADTDCDDPDNPTQEELINAMTYMLGEDRDAVVDLDAITEQDYTIEPIMEKEETSESESA